MNKTKLLLATAIASLAFGMQGAMADAADIEIIFAGNNGTSQQSCLDSSSSYYGQYDLDCGCGTFGDTYYQDAPNATLKKAICKDYKNHIDEYTFGGGSSKSFGPTEANTCYTVTTGKGSFTLISVDHGNTPVHIGQHAYAKLTGATSGSTPSGGYYDATIEKTDCPTTP